MAASMIPMAKMCIRDSTKVGKNEVSEETQKTFEGYTTIDVYKRQSFTI